MKQFKQNNKEIPIDENSHVFSMPTNKKIMIDENYDFLPTGFLFKVCSLLLYSIAYPILFIYAKLFCGLTIKNRKILKNVKTGMITVSNHIHILDAVFISLANFPHPLYFPTLKSNLEIPIISHLVKLFKGLPIPNTLNGKKSFYHVIENLLKNKQAVHFYPEASLWPYHTKLRNFRNGTFEFACSCNVPIVPVVYTYRFPKGFMKYIKKKPYITLTVLDPIYPNR